MGAPGAGTSPYFLKLTLCLHIRSLPTELEPPFINHVPTLLVHDSPSTGVGPEAALFQKLEDCELSDKLFVLEGRH